MKTFKKVRTKADILNDERVDDFHSDDSTGVLVYWLYLKEEYICPWEGGNTITTEDTIQYIKEVLNNKGGVIRKTLNTQIVL